MIASDKPLNWLRTRRSQVRVLQGAPLLAVLVLSVLPSCYLQAEERVGGNGIGAGGQAPVKVQIPLKAVSKLRADGLQSFVVANLAQREYTAILNLDGTIRYQTFPGIDPKLILPKGTVAVLHTHPYGTDPYPSDADIAATKKTGVPDCVVTREHLYCVLIDGKVVKIQ